MPKIVLGNTDIADEQGEKLVYTKNPMLIIDVAIAPYTVSGKYREHC